MRTWITFYRKQPSHGMLHAAVDGGIAIRVVKQEIRAEMACEAPAATLR